MRNVNPGIHDESAFGLFDRWLAEQEQQANDVAERAPGSGTGSPARLKAVPEPVEETAPADEGASADESEPEHADETESPAGPGADTAPAAVEAPPAPTAAPAAVEAPAAPAAAAAPNAPTAPRLPDAEARIEALLRSLGERRADGPREPRQGPPTSRAASAQPPSPGPEVAARENPQSAPETRLEPEPESEQEPEPTYDEFERYDDQPDGHETQPSALPVEASSSPTRTTRSTSSTTKMLLTSGAAALSRVREARAAKAADRRLQEPPAQEPPFPMVVEFAPRKGTKRLLGLLLLITATATGVSGWTAFQDQTTTAIGIAGTLAGLTAIIWATRAGSVVARLAVRMGQLEVVSNGALHRFDLTSHYTVVDVIGRPGSGGWKVIFHRRGMSPFVIDSSMVDPHAFMWVFNHYRPDPVDQF